MCLEIHSPTWTPLRRIMGSSSEIHEKSLAKNIRCTHCHLRRTLYLTGWVKACLNSTPLCALSNGPLNPTYLSPGHFLVGEPLPQLPFVGYTNVNCNRPSRWQTYKQKLQHFWQRWSYDYLQELEQRQRWQRTFPNLQLGNVVLLREDNTTPLHWPVAVINNIHPGPDGIVRVTTLRTNKGTFRRPTLKICPLLPLNSDL
jgi:hypothetical protein